MHLSLCLYALWKSCEFQFGFKKGIGCAECSHVVQEAIDYYLSNGTNSMLACALDLSKAYDRVSHYGLFCKLIKRGIPVAVVKLIEGWYTDQTLRVKWGGQLSEPVHVSNGVRQGGVLSPSLFNVVLDELLCKLKESGRDAKVGGQYVGGLAYADDIVLLSPTVSGLQSMLDMCGRFAEDNSMKFNVQKCSVTVFSRKSVTTDLYLRLCGHTVPVTNQFTHLGTLFKGDRDVSSSVKARIAKFYGAANAVVGRMGLLCREEEIWKKVMMRQLLPVLWYGSHLWNFKIKKVCKLVDSAWRRVTRKGLGLRATDSVRATVGDWFEEASELMTRQQILFLFRAIHSRCAVWW